VWAKRQERNPLVREACEITLEVRRVFLHADGLKKGQRMSIAHTLSGRDSRPGEVRGRPAGAEFIL